MKRIPMTILAVSLTLSACGTPSNDGDDNNDVTVSKDDARNLAGKGDSTDFCERFGWYNDDICDDFCAKPDPDCDSSDNNGTNNGDNNGDSPLCGGIAGLACAEGQVCQHPAGTCGLADGAGTCVAAPEACLDIWTPVCGCDGQTYSNDCYALSAGVAVDFEGECETPAPEGCGGIAGLTCAGGQVCIYPENTCGAADQLGACIEAPEFCPENYDPVCGCDGKTYSNECFAHGAGASIASEGECNTTDPGQFCGGIAGFQCPDGQVCQYDSGQCNTADSGGTCVPAADFCPAVYAPVCGCDGKTYGNDCEALSAGATVDHAGECGGGLGISCGGRAGQTCGADEYCYFQPNTFCDYADAQGVCKPRPDACTFEIDPVCGCDGTTYDNECMAAMAGTGLVTDMACTN